MIYYFILNMLVMCSFDGATFLSFQSALKSHKYPALNVTNLTYYIDFEARND